MIGGEVVTRDAVPDSDGRFNGAADGDRRRARRVHLSAAVLLASTEPPTVIGGEPSRLRPSPRSACLASTEPPTVIGGESWSASEGTDGAIPASTEPPTVIGGE